LVGKKVVGTLKKLENKIKNISIPEELAMFQPIVTSHILKTNRTKRIFPVCVKPREIPNLKLLSTRIVMLT